MAKSTRMTRSRIPGLCSSSAKQLSSPSTTTHKNDSESHILIPIVIEVCNDLADQHLVNGESRSILFLWGKLIGNRLDSCQPSLNLTAFGFALIVPGGHRR